MPKIDFVFFDAGGGHRAAATALKAALEAQGPRWQVRLVHLQDILGPVDVFKKYLRIDLQEIYNTILRNGWTLGSPQGLRIMQAVIHFNRGLAVPLIEKWFRSDPPDVLVSVVPNFNSIILEGFRRVTRSAPYVTVLTDLADYPPHFWIEKQEQYFICGSRRAVEQAHAMGHPPERVFAVNGMILHPRFYEAQELDRAAERRSLGLDPEKPTGLVLFGGFGSSAMEGILRRLQASSLDLQLILIAGRNEKLKSRLERIPRRAPVFIEGFTSRIPYYMRLADFFIGKPGPGSISEALHLGLPVITEKNAWTLPQERFNADWVTENGYGQVVSTFREVVPAVERMLASGALPSYQARISQLKIDALHEIPAILARIADIS